MSSHDKMDQALSANYQWTTTKHQKETCFHAQFIMQQHLYVQCMSKMSHFHVRCLYSSFGHTALFQAGSSSGSGCSTWWELMLPEHGLPLDGSKVSLLIFNLDIL